MALNRAEWALEVSCSWRNQSQSFQSHFYNNMSCFFQFFPWALNQQNPSAAVIGFDAVIQVEDKKTAGAANGGLLGWWIFKISSRSESQDVLRFNDIPVKKRYIQS